MKLKGLCAGLLSLIYLCVPAWAQTSVPGEWTWIAGSSTVPGEFEFQPGVYGSMGLPAAGNTPGGRNFAGSWTDNAGHLWLFGGLGSVPSPTPSLFYLNDLWEFDPETLEWAWINGSDTPGSNCPVISTLANCGRPGVYGTLGTPAAGNTPGGRYGSSQWVDSGGYLWLYGGEGFDAVGQIGFLSDLWRFDPATDQWTWMGGPSTITVNSTCGGCLSSQAPVPGTQGVAAPGNTPGGLWIAGSWTDTQGNFWLFSGWGEDPEGFGTISRDLWQYSPSTNEWAWMNGSSSFDTGPGTYGVLATPAAANVPGSRWNEATWTDAKGNLWLFGGQGYDSTNNEVLLNDLWEFDPSTSEWVWMGGSSTQSCSSPYSYCHEPGVYGVLGVPASGNIPGSRYRGYSWKDSSGNFWLFGGEGFDADSNFNYLNDLWEYFPAKNQWAWMGGPSLISSATAHGVYGGLGTPSPANLPGIRNLGVSWTDKNGNFWLWGGSGLDANGAYGGLNDLWVYQPTPGQLGTFALAGTAVSVAPGATAGNRSTITVTPAGDFAGNVGLTAVLTSSPSGAVQPPTFTFDGGSTVAISGNRAGTATLTISTTASSSSGCAASNQSALRVPWYAGSGVILSGVWMLGVPRRRRRWNSLLGAALLVITLAGGALGCGFTGKAIACPNVVTPGTTAGTYVITVTGASGAITHTGTVTLTVQ